MLYVRTGANGSCKSLFTLKDVREQQLKELRPVCVIVGDAQDPARQYVKVKATKMQEFGWTTCTFDKWWDQPDGTIFFGDECHNYLPKRPNGSAVPLHVSRLAEHRARGFDFFLLTQHPSNIDSFVTKLVGAPGWHQHLKRAFGASNVTSVLQWAAVNNQCEKDGAGKSAQVTMRSQPQDVYSWYESAELHTGKRKIPKQFWMVVVGVPLALAMMFGAGKLLYGRTVGKGQAQQQAQPGAGAPGAAQGTGGGDQRARPLTRAEYTAAYQPRIQGLMHSAPAYDKLTEPKRVPVPAACVQSATAVRPGAAQGCKCYTQDATPYPVPESVCRDLVAHGAFLAFQPEGGEGRRDGFLPREGHQNGLQALNGPALVVMDGVGFRDPQGAQGAKR